MKIITWPENLSVSKVREFWNNAGFKEGTDYRIGNTEKGKLFLKPLTQIFLAQDAIALGFKIEDGAILLKYYTNNGAEVQTSADTEGKAIKKFIAAKEKGGANFRQWSFDCGKTWINY